MGTSNAKASAKAIEDRIERFIGDILDVIRRLRHDALAAALGVGAKQPARRARPQQAPPRRPASSSAPASKRPAPAARAPAAEARGLGIARKPRRGRVVIERSTAPVVENGAADAPAPSDREAAVIDAVRALVRATAAEISRRSGLPNGSVYAMLRSLAARGQVAKIETARGVEYGLVSAGGIRPFKRSKNATNADGAADGAPKNDAPTAEPSAPEGSGAPANDQPAG